MAAEDDVNRVLREFQRYTGDGLPGEPANAPLPVGDPSSGVHNPKKSGLRAMLLAVLQRAQDILDQAAAGFVPDGGVTEPKLATGGVSTRALAAGAATLAKIGDDAKADFRMVSAQGPRNRLQYASATSVFVYGTQFPLGGCYINGGYRKGRVKLLNSANEVRQVSTATDLAFGQTSVKLENWQAVFCGQVAGAAEPVFRIAPYLFVKSRDGSGVLTLGKCGEQEGVAAGTIDAATYSWANNALVGAEVLVITDRPSGAGNFAPRMTTVTSNTATTMTLANLGNVRDNCLLLLVPKDFDAGQYRWCGDFYVDTAEIRNFYDDGRLVATRGPNLAYYHEQSAGISSYLSGAIAQHAKYVNCNRFISPLSTAVVVQEFVQLATTSAGQSATYFDPDGSNHYIAVHFQEKGSGASGPGTESYSSLVTMPFLYNQGYQPWTSGSIEGSRYNVAHNVNGYIL